MIQKKDYIRNISLLWQKENTRVVKILINEWNKQNTISPRILLRNAIKPFPDKHR